MARFTRTFPPPQVRGDYTKFRPYVREDFQRLCAYCLVPEDDAQGPEGFQLDHFRPQKKFEDEINNFYNLYYCCYVCNQKKSHHWPSEELQQGGFYFVDLCVDNFDDHYNQLEDGTWQPLTPAAKYTIDTIKLNREHLVRLRQRRAREGVYYR